MCVCEPRVTRPVRQRVADRGPRQHRSTVGEVPPALDEVGGEVERGRHLMAHQDRQRLVDEVGSTVVEGHDDAVAARGCGGCVGLAARQLERGQRVVERQRGAPPGDEVDLGVEALGGQIDLVRRRSTPDPVVGEHDDARRPGLRAGPRTQLVVHARRVLQRALPPRERTTPRTRRAPPDATS